MVDPTNDAIVDRRMRAQGLWGRGIGRPEEVVHRLTAMQAQEHSFARWSVGQRATGAVTGAKVDAAFDEGRILRTHVLRPTWHFVAQDDLRWLIALSGPRVDAGNARRYHELELDARTRSRAAEVIAGAVAGTNLTRREIAGALERRGISAAGQRIAYLVMYAELHGVICSGPMRGKEHTYAAFDERVPPSTGPSGEEALAELARRYFTTRGPATVRDFGWWSGLRAAEAKRALEAVARGLERSVVDGRTYWLAKGRPASRGKRSRVDLVQCYDEAIISYTESRDVLPTAAASFPVPRHLDGFVHVVLLDGRLLGHWRLARNRGGAVAVETRIAQRLGADQRAALDLAIERLVRFLGEVGETE